MPVVGLCPGSGAAPARRARLRGIAFRGGVPFVTGPRWPARRDLESRLASRHAADANSRIATGEIAVAQAAEPSGTHPGLMMPTRTQVRSHRIAAERQHNVDRISRRRLLLPARPARDYEPPRF